MKKKISYFLMSGVLVSQLILPSIFAYAAEIKNEKNSSILEESNISSNYYTWEYNLLHTVQYNHKNILLFCNFGLPFGDYLTFDVMYFDNVNLNIDVIYADGTKINHVVETNKPWINIYSNDLSEVKIQGSVTLDGQTISFDDVIQIKRKK